MLDLALMAHKYVDVIEVEEAIRPLDELEGHKR